MHRVIPLGDVIDLKKFLAGTCPAVTVHLHDACGGQTLSLEAEPETRPEARSQVERFFAARHEKVAFDPSGTTFWGAWE